MRIEQWKYEGVDESGKCVDGGAVEVGGVVRFSHSGGGCGLEGCQCSNGHWLCVSFPRTLDGIVEGVTIRFDNEIQLIKFIDNIKAALNER